MWAILRRLLARTNQPPSFVLTVFEMGVLANSFLDIYYLIDGSVFNLSSSRSETSCWASVATDIFLIAEV